MGRSGSMGLLVQEARSRALVERLQRWPTAMTNGGTPRSPPWCCGTPVSPCQLVYGTGDADSAHDPNLESELSAGCQPVYWASELKRLHQNRKCYESFFFWIIFGTQGVARILSRLRSTCQKLRREKRINQKEESVSVLRLGDINYVLVMTLLPT